MDEVVVHELEREKPEEKCCDEDRRRGTEHHDAIAAMRRDSHWSPFIISRWTACGRNTPPVAVWRRGRRVYSPTDAGLLSRHAMAFDDRRKPRAQ